MYKNFQKSAFNFKSNETEKDPLKISIGQI